MSTACDDSLSGFRVTEAVDLFARRNPTRSRATVEAAGRAAAALGQAVAKLSMADQARLVAHRKELPGLIATVVARLGNDESPAPPISIKPGRDVELATGAGLGVRLDREQGLRAVSAFAVDMPLEQWAGPVAGASELERRLGIRRSTLHDWRHQGAVIGLLRGTRKQVFPLTQFIDGRPVEGLPRILATIKSPRTAWLWLIESNPSLEGKTPIDRLKAGRIEDVARVVEADFGPP